MRRIAGLAAVLAFLLGAAAQATEPVDLLIRHAATVDVAAGTVTPERAIAVRVIQGAIAQHSRIPLDD